MRRDGIVAGLLLGVLIAAGAARAQEVVPVGEEFQVNTYTTDDQTNPDVAPIPTGGFVVVWDSYGSDGSDQSDSSVQAQLYDEDGAPIGDQFQVNSSATFFYQEFARASPDGSDGFVVVWRTSYEGQFFFSVHGQRFDSAGTPVSGEFELNSNTGATAVLSPTVAPHPAGGFITVWTSEGSLGDDSSGRSIQARRWGPDGTPAGPDFQVNTTTLDDQGGPAVSPISEEEYVVVWWSYTSSGSDDDEMSIQGQRFDGSDQPIGGEFQVNTYTPARQWRPDVAPHGEGGFVVVWTSDGSSGADTDGDSVQGQRFLASGAPLGPQFEINTYTTEFQSSPRVVADETGGFVVVWSSSGSYGTDDGSSVQGRRYAADGSPQGGEFQVNTYTTSLQGRPALSLDSSGRLVVVWRSFGSSGNDLDGFSVQGQRYELGIFADGFESGDTSAWSNTVP